MIQKEERRVAIVTGGGTGVGAATCRLLAEAQFNVAIINRRSLDAAAHVVEECRSLGADAIAIEADVADDEACRRAIAKAEEHWGRVDALVNSAGATQFVPLSDLDKVSAADFQQVYAVNVIGTYQMVRAATPLLRRGGAGAVVNVSSIGSLNGNGSSYPYVTSKAALNTLTLALARSLAPQIRVNAVLPGMIETRWLRDGLGEEAYLQMRDQWASAAALERVCTAEDIAKTIAWLLIDANVITGQLIVADAGFLLGRPARVSR